MSAVMIDTNVLIYRRDASEPRKRDRANRVLTIVGGRGCVTTQVLGEYFSVVLRKFLHVTQSGIARSELDAIAGGNRVLPVTAEVVLDAARGVEEHGLSFYDAQIWAAARLNSIPIILTEDFTHGRVIEGVRYIDPFCEDFDPSQLD